MSDSIGQAGQGTQYTPEMVEQLQTRQARQAARDAVVEEQDQALAAQLPAQETGFFRSFLNKTLDLIDKIRQPNTLPDLEKAKKKSTSSPNSSSSHVTPRGAAPEQTSTIDGRNSGGNSEITLPLGHENITLRGIDIKDLHYVERPDEEQQELRKQFDSKYRKQFLKNTAGNPDNLETLKKAGLTDRDIQMMQNGKVPPGYQVHHKIPLDDGGTNDFSNFVLIKNDPPHKAITNYQMHLVKGIHDGGSPDLKWPVPPGFIYPTDSSQVTTSPQ